MEISTRVKNQANQSKPLSRFGKIFFRNSGRLSKGFLLILAATLVATAIILWVDGRPKPLSLYFYTGLSSLVYSSCIGGTLILGLNFFLPKIIAQGLWIKILFLALLIFVSTFVGLFFGGFVLLALGMFPANEYLSSALDSWRISLFMGVLFGTFAFLSDSLKLRLEKTELELRTWQLAEERARSLAAEAKLSSLESRVRPHFLFNTLNSISALIGEEPEKAEKNVERLARLLRFSLDEANQKTVTLRAEMKVVQDYLEIEKTRFGERLRFSIKIPEKFLECRVPPFAIQTSVENSIKHVVSQRRTGGEIRVLAAAEDEFLRLEVWDDGDDSEFHENSIIAGHGLDNLQARLAATFGDDARLNISRQNDYTIVSVFIPLTEMAER